MDNAQGVRPLTRKLAGVTVPYVWMPNHAVGSAADKTRAVVSGAATEATLIGTNTTAYSANPGWMTCTGDLCAFVGQTAALAALMDLQTLGSGSLLICCDIRAAANPSANVSLWGRATNSAATNGAYHARATTAGVIDIRMTPVGGSEGTLNAVAGALITTGARQSLAFWFDGLSGNIQIYSQGATLGTVSAMPSLATRPKAAANPNNDYGICFGARMNSATTVAGAMEAGAAAMRTSNGLVVRFSADQSANIGAVVRDIARFPFEARRVVAGLT